MIGLSFAILLPIFMLLGFFPVPAAFVLYWTFTNVLATAQSLRAYRLPMEPIVKKNTKPGGTYPQTGGFFAKLQDQARKAQEEQERQKGGGGTSTNGSLNGKTGTPAKHKPKKRK